MDTISNIFNFDYFFHYSFSNSAAVASTKETIEIATGIQNCIILKLNNKFAKKGKNMVNNSTLPSATIAGQIIQIFEDNKLTIAQAKQILIDVENALNAQKVKSNTQTGSGVFPAHQTMGIVEYVIKG